MTWSDHFLLTVDMELTRMNARPFLCPKYWARCIVPAWPTAAYCALNLAGETCSWPVQPHRSRARRSGVNTFIVGGLTSGRLQESLTNYPNRPAAQRGGV